MPAKRYKIELSKEEREELLGLIKKGKERARKLIHARILLDADQSEQGAGRNDAEISEIVHVSVSTIERVRQQFVEEGYDRALNHKQPYRSRPKKLDGEVEARLSHLACSNAPEERVHWTLKLLADELVKLEVVESIAPETVRLGLKKMSLNLG